MFSIENRNTKEKKKVHKLWTKEKKEEKCGKKWVKMKRIWHLHRCRWWVECNRSSRNAIVASESMAPSIQSNCCSCTMDIAELLCSRTWWSTPVYWFVWSSDSEARWEKNSISYNNNTIWIFFSVKDFSKECNFSAQIRPLENSFLPQLQVL